MIIYTQCLLHARCFGSLIDPLNHPLFTTYYYTHFSTQLKEKQVGCPKNRRTK